SQGSVGCDFFTMPPDDKGPDGRPGACFATFIANTWSEAVTLGAKFGDDALDISMSTYLAPTEGVKLTPLHGPLDPGQVAIVFLSGGDKCPGGITALPYNPMFYGTVMNEAFRITTDRPVSAYSIYPFGGASSEVTSAMLLLPVSSWTTNYLAVN